MAVTFESIPVGSTITRPDLARMWNYRGWRGFGKGAFTPSNDNKIVLFITKEKQTHLTQYDDSLEGDVLAIDGERNHRTDLRIANAQRNGDEIHLFYRQRHHSPFTYHGQLTLSSHQLHTDRPSKFVFQLTSLATALSSIETEQTTHGIIDPNFVPDEEGRRIIRTHVTFERSPRNRARAIQLHGSVCVACGFDFNGMYGRDWARSYIEVHHVRSITRTQGRVDPATELAPLCSNCHSMSHRERGRILSVAELKQLIAANREKRSR